MDKTLLEKLFYVNQESVNNALQKFRIQLNENIAFNSDRDHKTCSEI